MERFKFIKGRTFDQLPKTSGVYCFKVIGVSETPILYIGKAINIQNRVKNHFKGNYWWEKTLLRQGFAGRVGFIKTNSEIEALILEAHLIKKYQPKFNVVWRDDKNYFYVAIELNAQKIPYIFITHQPKTGGRPTSAQFIGPFVDGTSLKKTLRYLRRAFPYYTTKTHIKTKCTWCHLELCPGPKLFGNPTSPEASRGLREYRRNIKKLILILQGKRSAVLNSLKREMKIASKNKKYEEAAKIRDRMNNLEYVMSHAGVIESRDFVRSDLTKSLREILGLENIHRIECYDVSNIQGKSATGSMIVFIDGKPDKNQYRKFKIRMENEPNDIAMLKEIISRRLAHKEWPYPEVMLIDGGKGQLNAALEIVNSIKIENLKLKIRVISIAKGKRELFIENCNKPIPLKNLSQEIQNLIIYLDDEAHRFAIAYHKKLRKKSLLQ